MFRLSPGFPDADCTRRFRRILPEPRPALPADDSVKKNIFFSPLGISYSGRSFVLRPL